MKRDPIIYVILLVLVCSITETQGSKQRTPDHALGNRKLNSLVNAVFESDGFKNFEKRIHALELELFGGCNGTRWGCCPDGKTFAQGPDHAGCPPCSMLPCGVNNMCKENPVAAGGVTCYCPDGFVMMNSHGDCIPAAECTSECTEQKNQQCTRVISHELPPRDVFLCTCQEGYRPRRKGCVQGLGSCTSNPCQRISAACYNSILIGEGGAYCGPASVPNVIGETETEVTGDETETEVTGDETDTEVTGDMLCTNPIPGSDKLVDGVDLTELDMFPMSTDGSSGLANGGRRLAVLAFTCNDKQTWTDGSTGITYDRPDQVSHIETKPAGYFDPESTTYKNEQELRKSMSAEVGASGIFEEFAFSESASFKSMQKTLMTSEYYISDTTAYESSTEVQMTPILNTAVRNFLDSNVVGTYDTNPQGYKDFITSFGTHYFVAGNLGGIIRQIQQTNIAYFRQESDEEATVNAEASFAALIKAKGGSTTQSTNVDSDYRSMSSNKTYYYGGNPDLMNQGIKSWQPTVSKDPWLMSGQLQPITDLIADDTKRINMITAARQHLIKAALLELKSTLTNIVAQGQVSLSDVTDFLNKIDTFQNESVINETDFQQFSDNVHFAIDVPSWYEDNVKLCYKFAAEITDWECSMRDTSSPVPNCATPNSMTNYYRDDTTSYPGGCRMSWQLNSTVTVETPSWWSSETQICMRYRAEETLSECGGINWPPNTNEMCISINQWLTYRDDTGEKRAGGCFLSWMIKVPDEAPLWIKTSQFCLGWMSENDAEQCGDSNTNNNIGNYCAPANNWTPEYRDDTRGDKSGGCFMRWGLVTKL